jgi:hypothetical protein
MFSKKESEMGYIVFHTASPHAEKRYFKTASGAKRATTCANRNAGYLAYNWVEESWFLLKYPVGMMTVKNLMTGQDVEIPEDTPWCCNPASETYWST